MVKVLEITNLSYKDFDNLNMSFDNKTFYSIIGPNNCGKTTLFKLIAGFIPSNDAIFCNNISLNKNNIKEYIVNLGIVDRINRNSFLFNNVIDEMMYPLSNIGYSKKYQLTRINEVLELFKVTDYADKRISELNTYEKQLLLIMIAILHKPKVLIIDSVLELFPITMKSKIVKVLKSLVSDITIINFTSCLDEAYFSDKIVLLDNYKIIGEYYPSDIYKDDKLFYEHGLEIPLITDLSIKLGMYKLINKEYDDLKAMVDDIWP